MSKKIRLSVLDIVINLVLIILLVVAFIPVLVNRMHRQGGPASQCQSNLTQIGRALKMYLMDWDNTYPTNRIWHRNGKLGPIQDHIKLSVKPGSMPDSGGKFKYGLDWVEALQSYVETAAVSTDSSSIWHCTSLSDETYPAGADSACISYVYNRNIVEKREDIINDASNLMIARESGKLVNADLRPINDSTGSPKKMPISPFLNGRDIKTGKTKALLHGEGSHILFADGHVKFFNILYFPSKPQWDPETRQWYNFANSQDPSLNKSIAITP